MFTISSAELNAFILSFFLPLVRVLALVFVAPVFSSAALPRRIRLIFGMAVALGLHPLLPPPPAPLEPNSLVVLMLVGQQILIGVALGFAMRIAFAAIAVAGEFIGFQMGLSFATFYDPHSSANTAVVTEFINLFALLVFLSLNGHLTMIATLAESFIRIPVFSPFPHPDSWLSLVRFAGLMFSGGLLLALPVVVALSITNIALAVLSRAAPQLNLIAVGFPITLAMGMVLLGLSLPSMVAPLMQLIDQSISASLLLFKP
ncbi:flagellar biosynthetic protein FliR [Oryzomicrobium sp.]|uniref:flagellar biosynthetic protein FliR n=1 Tax=Oryzomicrobium sp. TaxID=1911578 RepID=UPI002FE1A03E